ncbi:hypothetical protein LY76DRAFT_639636 [Colletotrichum caudatum]|nr:hypothetical protein LY76DRAFT_639636 [Colletotrichum caudatum]
MAAALPEQDLDLGDDSWTEIQAPSTTAGPSVSHDAPAALAHQLAEAASTPLAHLAKPVALLDEIPQAPPSPPAKAPEKPADRDRRGMDPTTRTRLLKACADILQIVGPSSFTNQSARDPLEHRLQGLVRCAAFAVQAAAAEEVQLANRESALDTTSGDQEEKDRWLLGSSQASWKLYFRNWYGIRTMYEDFAERHVAIKRETPGSIGGEPQSRTAVIAAVKCPGNPRTTR